MQFVARENGLMLRRASGKIERLKISKIIQILKIIVIFAA